MKQIIAILAAFTITSGAMAYPHGGFGAGRPAARPVVIVHQPYYGGFGYRPYYSPYWGFNSLYAPYGYGYAVRPSKLDLNIAQINNDYSEQISDVRHDKSLSGSERRSQIRDLRHERNNSIIQAKQNYYHPGTHIGTAVAPNNDDANAAQ